jgi:hypothetical protein
MRKVMIFGGKKIDENSEAWHKKNAEFRIRDYEHHHVKFIIERKETVLFFFKTWKYVSLAVTLEDARQKINEIYEERKRSRPKQGPPIEYFAKEKPIQKHEHLVSSPGVLSGVLGSLIATGGVGGNGGTGVITNGPNGVVGPGNPNIYNANQVRIQILEQEIENLEDDLDRMTKIATDSEHRLSDEISKRQLLEERVSQLQEDLQYSKTLSELLQEKNLPEDGPGQPYV